jgi:PAS domain S-box-containing protein
MSNWRTQLGLSLFSWWLCIISSMPLFGLDRDIQIDQLHHTAWTADNAGIGETKQIVQTSDGFLWLLTSDDRLLRFDGFRFEPIETAMAGALPTGEHRWDDVFSIEAVPDGGLWIGHAQPRVDLLKNGQVHTFSTQNCFPNAPIDVMVQDHEGALWMATPRGLGRLQDTQCNSIGPDWSYSGGEPVAMLVDRGGTLWVKSQDGRLFFLRHGAKAFEINASGSGDSTPTGSLAQAPDGSIWQASLSGVQRILQGRDDRPGIRAPRLGPHAESVRILFDRDGALWIAMEDGLHRIPYPDRLVPWQPERAEKIPSKALKPSVKADRSSQTFTVDQGLSSNVIWDVFQDGEGNIWTATGAGLDRFRNNAFIRAPLHPTHQGQFTFAAGERGTVWAANWDSPLFNLGDRVRSTHPFKPENISALYRDPAGVIWVGTLGKSIWHSSSSGFVRAGWPPGEGETYVRAMSMDHAGGLWVSLATGGIFRLADGLWTRQNDRLGIPASIAVYSIDTDDHGRVWFNTGWVWLLDGDEVRKFDHANGVERGYATSIEVKGPHTWLGGVFGLALFMNNHFQVIQGVGGEVFRVTTGIIELSDGDVWINTESGVVRIPAAEVQKVIREPAYQVQFNRFDNLDGLDGKATYWIPVPTAIAGLDGKLWFSTNKGVFWVDPERIAGYRNLQPPPVHVEQITVDHTTYDASSDVTSAAKGHLRLPPRVRDLTIDYTALSFVAPEKVLFRYKLEGWDRDWQSAGNRRRAFFTNLPPGNYRFRVTACNNSGVWNEQGTTLDFAIAPAYYQTVWFRSLGVFLFLAVLTGLYRLRLRHLERQRDALRKNEKELRDVIDTIPALVWSALPDGSNIYVNKRFVEYTGSSAEQTAGSGWQALVHPDDLERHASKWMEAVATGKPHESEVRSRRWDGQYRWQLDRGVPLRDEDGNVVKWYGVTTDIEDRKRAEETRQLLSLDLQESNAKLEEAQRITHVGYWEWDVVTGRVNWSDESYRIYGLQPQEHPIELAEIREMIHPEDRAFVFRTAEEALRGGARTDVEHRIVRPKGEVRIVHSQGDVKRDASGRLYQMFGTVQDITDRKRAEEALQRSQFYINEGQRIAHMGSWAFDAAGFSYWSSELFRIYGLDPSGKPPSVEEYLALVHPEDRAFMKQGIAKMLDDHLAFDFTKRIVRPDGEIRDVRCVGVPVTQGGVFQGFLGTGMDVTEQERLTAKLRLSEQYLSEGQRLARMGSWTFNPSGFFEYWSQELFKVYGLDPQKGAPTLEAYLATLHPQDRDVMANTIKRMCAEHCGCDEKKRIIRPDGELRYIRCVGVPVVEGEVLKGFLGTAMDITEQELLTQELKRQQAHLTEAQKLTHTASWAWRVPDRNAVEVSEESYRIYGFDPAEGAPTWEEYLERVHPEDRLKWKGITERAIVEKNDYDHEFRILLPNGMVKWIHTVGHPVLSNTGDLEGFVGSSTDITERKSAEEALQRSEAYLAEAQRLSHTGSWAWNPASDNTYYSEECYRVLGLAPGDGTPPPLETIIQRIHPDDQAQCRERVEKAIRDKVDFELDYRIVHPDKSFRDIHCVCHTVLDRSGDLAELVGTVIDVTELKSAEREREKLRQLEGDLAHTNRVSTLGEMAASLAHEIKQPIAAAITSANSCIEWLAHEPPNLDRARAAAARIDKYGNRAAEIIDRIRSLYKKSPPQRELVDVNGIIQEMLTLLEGEATRSSIAMRTDLSAELPKIMVDRVQLQQVFMNLMLNAIEAMKDSGGELTVKSERQDGRLQFSLSDTGVGLPTEKMDQIFSAFFTTKTQGSGMGLAISRSIVESHGGRLWATANDGRGATFHFTLPIQVTESSTLVA